MNNPIEARIAPFINVPFMITQIFGRITSDGSPHRGLDIATATSLGNVELYSVCEGQVILNQYDNSYGWYIILKGDDGMGYLYAHLNSRSLVDVGSRVSIGTLVGYEGTSGTSTGIHLHMEMQNIKDHPWLYRQPITAYENPAVFMGIPNVYGTWAEYNGIPLPPTPTEKKNRHFPWVLYARKLRSR